MKLEQAWLWLTLTFLTASTALGCQQKQAAEAEARAAAASASAAAELSKLKKLEAKVAFRRLEVRRRLEEGYEKPKESSIGPCPAELETTLQNKTARRLVLRVNDTRPGARDLLPLRMTRPLETRELDALDRYYTPGSSPALVRRPLRDEGAANEALALLDSIERQPLAGVLHVTAFIAPRWQLKKDQRGYEWVAGWMFALFSIHRIEDGRALCSLKLEIKNDVSETSPRRALREQTRRELEVQLAERARADIEARLSTLHPLLELPLP